MACRRHKGQASSPAHRHGHPIGLTELWRPRFQSSFVTWSKSLYVGLSFHVCKMEIIVLTPPTSLPSQADQRDSGCSSALDHENSPVSCISRIASRFFTTESLGKPMRIMTSSLFCRHGQTLKFTWEEKGAKTTNTTLKKNKVGGFTISNFTIYHKGTVTKTVQYW